MNLDNRFIIRQLRATDRDYIARTLLYGHFMLSSCAKKNNRDSFLNGHNKVVNALLDHAEILLIVDTEDTDLIYSFIIFERGLGDYDVIHYAHTRKDFRELGLLSQLKDIIKTKNNLAISHWNDIITPARLKKYYEKVICDQYLLNIKDRK